MDKSTSYSETKLLWLVRLADAVLPALVGLGALAFYDGGIGDDGLYLVAIATAVLLTANAFHLLGLYSIDGLGNIQRQIARLLVGWACVLGLLLLAAFAAKVTSHFSRVWSLTWFVGTAGGFLVLRLAVHELLRHWSRIGRLTRDIAIVGAGDHAQRLIEHLRRHGERDFRVVGVFDDRAAGRAIPPVAGVEVRGTVDDLVALARRRPLDQIVVAMPWANEARIMGVMRRLWTLPIDIRLAPDRAGFGFAHCSYGPLAGLPVLNVFDKPLSGDRLVVKRLEDIALSLGLLTVFAPLMLTVAALIKLDSPGPVLFRQRRFGFNNRPIEVWKFRTMAHDAEAETEITAQTARRDPRVTRLGRLLRRTSIDELPQLFNVLAGTMSVVGPRPHAAGTRAADVPFEEAVAEYTARHRVKPGLTGWAQVNGWRGETDTVEKIQRRVEHDLYYIEHWSLLLDVKIVFMTVFAVLRGRNAW